MSVPEEHVYETNPTMLITQDLLPEPSAKEAGSEVKRTWSSIKYASVSSEEQVRTTLWNVMLKNMAKIKFQVMLEVPRHYQGLSYHR